MQVYKKGNQVVLKKPKEPFTEFSVEKEPLLNISRVKTFVKELATDNDTISNAKNQLSFLLNDKFGEGFNSCNSTLDKVTIFYIWVLPMDTEARTPFSYDIFYCRKELSTEEIEYCKNVMKMIDVFVHTRKLNEQTPKVDSITLVINESSRLDL